MVKKKKQPKPRNAQDSTRRNVQAANKRIKKLEEQVARIRAFLVL